MLKVGITGGIGSGKSLVCNLFKLLGIPVYNADIRAKQLQEENEKVKHKIQHYFGKEVFDKQGRLNRKKMASIVFKDKKALEKLNSIVHPAVGKDFKQWLQNYKEKSYILKEAALIFETGSYRKLDKVITVTAPETLRVQRIIERDNITEDQVYKRMERQWSQGYKEQAADFVIQNDEHHMVIPQVWRIHDKLLVEKT